MAVQKDKEVGVSLKPATFSEGERIEEQGAKTVRRREARSGRVSYSDPVVLHESSRQRIVLVPFYVHRTEGTDLAIKTTTSRPRSPGQ